jgi:hypothetical protein
MGFVLHNNFVCYQITVKLRAITKKREGFRSIFCSQIFKMGKTPLKNLTIA